jgi:hypothetical protein
MCKEVFNTEGFSLGWLVPSTSHPEKYDVENELHTAIVGVNPEESQE